MRAAPTTIRSRVSGARTALTPKIPADKLFKSALRNALAQLGAPIAPPRGVSALKRMELFQEGSFKDPVAVSTLVPRRADATTFYVEKLSSSSAAYYGPFEITRSGSLVRSAR